MTCERNRVFYFAAVADHIVPGQVLVRTGRANAQHGISAAKRVK
jgi:hypothetical protein